MYCSKCGKYIEDDSSFCSNCGAPILKDASASNFKKGDKSILLYIKNKLGKRRLIALVSAIVSVFILFFCILQCRQQIEKKRLREQMEYELAESIKHKQSIVGHYENNETYSGRIRLDLFSDNTALLIIGEKPYYDYHEYRGYWEEAYNLIEIRFSQSFEMYINRSHDKYCSVIYMYDSRLWLSTAAIRSKDYDKSEYMKKRSVEEENKIKEEEKKRIEREAKENESTKKSNLIARKKYENLGYINIEEDSNLMYKELRKGYGKKPDSDDVVIYNSSFASS